MDSSVNLSPLFKGKDTILFSVILAVMLLLWG